MQPQYLAQCREGVEEGATPYWRRKTKYRVASGWLTRTEPHGSSGVFYLAAGLVPALRHARTIAAPKCTLFILLACSYPQSFEDLHACPNDQPPPATSGDCWSRSSKSR